MKIMAKSYLPSKPHDSHDLGDSATDSPQEPAKKKGGTKGIKGVDVKAWSSKTLRDDPEQAATLVTEMFRRQRDQVEEESWHIADQTIWLNQCLDVTLGGQKAAQELRGFLVQRNLWGEFLTAMFESLTDPSWEPVLVALESNCRMDRKTMMVEASWMGMASAQNFLRSEPLVLLAMWRAAGIHQCLRDTAHMLIEAPTLQEAGATGLDGASKAGAIVNQMEGILCVPRTLNAFMNSQYLLGMGMHAVMGRQSWFGGMLALQSPLAGLVAIDLGKRDAQQPLESEDQEMQHAQAVAGAHLLLDTLKGIRERHFELIKVVPLFWREVDATAAEPIAKTMSKGEPLQVLPVYEDPLKILAKGVWPNKTPTPCEWFGIELHQFIDDKCKRHDFGNLGQSQHFLWMGLMDQWAAFASQGSTAAQAIDSVIRILHLSGHQSPAGGLIGLSKLLSENFDWAERFTAVAGQLIQAMAHEPVLQDKNTWDRNGMMPVDVLWRFSKNLDQNHPGLLIASGLLGALARSPHVSLGTLSLITEHIMTMPDVALGKGVFQDLFSNPHFSHSDAKSGDFPLYHDLLINLLHSVKTGNDDDAQITAEILTQMLESTDLASIPAKSGLHALGAALALTGAMETMDSMKDGPYAAKTMAWITPFLKDVITLLQPLINEPVFDIYADYTEAAGGKKKGSLLLDDPRFREKKTPDEKPVDVLNTELAAHMVSLGGRRLGLKGSFARFIGGGPKSRGVEEIRQDFERLRGTVKLGLTLRDDDFPATRTFQEALTRVDDQLKPLAAAWAGYPQIHDAIRQIQTAARKIVEENAKSLSDGTPAADEDMRHILSAVESQTLQACTQLSQVSDSLSAQSSKNKSGSPQLQAATERMLSDKKQKACQMCLNILHGIHDGLNLAAFRIVERASEVALLEMEALHVQQQVRASALHMRHDRERAFRFIRASAEVEPVGIIEKERALDALLGGGHLEDDGSAIVLGSSEPLKMKRVTP